MVYGLIGQGIARVATRAGLRTGTRIFKEFGRYDRSLHQSVFGRSGGRGFRHGRDAGLAISGFARGDELDAPQTQLNPPSKQYQARSRYGKRGRTGRRCYNYSGGRRRRVPCRSKPRTGQQRFRY